MGKVVLAYHCPLNVARDQNIDFLSSFSSIASPVVDSGSLEERAVEEDKVVEEHYTLPGRKSG